MHMGIMRSKPQIQLQLCAFTIFELTIVLAVALVLTAILLPRFVSGRDKGKHPRIICVNNLKNVGLAYRIFATDHNDQFPWQITNSALPNPVPGDDLMKYILAVTNEISTPKILHCPEDRRKQADSWTNFNRQNLSYFVSEDASEFLPASFLSGDRNIASSGVIFPPGRAKIPHRYIPKLSWAPILHRTQGNACMGDGSVQQLSGARLRDAWRNQGSTNSVTTFLFP
jgi:type II secretory pathway pseudopilin PulG